MPMTIFYHFTSTNGMIITYYETTKGTRKMTTGAIVAPLPILVSYVCSHDHHYGHHMQTG